MEPLPHLCAAMREEDGAVCVDVDQRPALVQELGREGDPELDGEHGDAALAPPVGEVPLRDGLATLLEPSQF